VRDKNKLEKLAELKKLDGYKHILTAPVSIVVCVDIEKSPSRFIEDGVTAIQNMLLAIHELGLGSVYLSASKLSVPENAQKVREILSLSKRIIPIAILPIGYFDPSEILDEKNLINLNSIIHHDNW
jgi:nitroreductase